MNQAQRLKFMYEDIGIKNYQIFEPSTQIVTGITQSQRQIFFTKYSRSQSDVFNKNKNQSQLILPAEDGLSINTYNSSLIEMKLPEKLNHFEIKEQQRGNQVQQYRKKVTSLQRQLTKICLQKGELIIQLAELQRQNCNLKRQIRKKEEINFVPHLVNSTEGNIKIQIDEDLVNQIQHIAQQQKQINKIKEEYIQLASIAYQNQIKKLRHQNHSYKIQIQSLKVDLEIAKQDLKQKQLKIQFLLKEKSSLEQKSPNSSKLYTQTDERNNQGIYLRHNLSALEMKYRALSVELMNKEEYILKFITNRRVSQDLQAVKGLVFQNDPYALRQRDHISQVESQFQTSSQVRSVTIKNTQQL